MQITRGPRCTASRRTDAFYQHLQTIPITGLTEVTTDHSRPPPTISSGPYRSGRVRYVVRVRLMEYGWGQG